MVLIQFPNTYSEKHLLAAASSVQESVYFSGHKNLWTLIHSRVEMFSGLYFQTELSSQN